MRKILWFITILAVLIGLHQSHSDAGHEANLFIGWAIVAWICIAAFLIPTLLAYRRNHPSKLAIALVNVLLGWSIIGWIVALIWAATNTAGSQQVVLNNHYAPPQAPQQQPSDHPLS